jgi:hypothetical protein
MDRIHHRRNLQINPQHQIAINAMVESLIAKRGYHSIIDQLVAAVYNLGEISLADPENSAKLRDFDMWAQAVRTAILNHDPEQPFENRVTPFDRQFAAKLKISLD